MFKGEAICDFEALKKEADIGSWIFQKLIQSLF